MASLETYWYRPNPVSVLLLPLSWLFCAVAMARRFLYRSRILRTERLPVPVIVIGNITVGGTGKTPLVVTLIEYLKQQGFRPGIVSRGYGGQAGNWPQPVYEHSDPRVVGDEPVLLAQHCRCPMSVGPDRPQAARSLLKQHACDVIVSDDGLQHYALHRDIEIVVIDGDRRFGNGHCLPAGPLREPLRRLAEAHYLISNGEPAPGEIRMSLQVQAVYNLKQPNTVKALTDFRAAPVHAVAGIGNPGRFFRQLKDLGLEVIEHAYKDHHRYGAQDIGFGDDLPVLMTEKDAVKCRAFARERHWVVPVRAVVEQSFLQKLTEQLRKNHG